MRRTCILVAVAALAVAWAIGPATAWAGDGFAREVPEIEDPSAGWQAWLFSAVAVAGIAAVGFKNAKRTHLD